MAGPSRALLCVAATPAGWPRIGTGWPATLSVWLSASGLRLPLPLPPSSPWFPGRARQRREAREKCGRHRVVPRLPHGLLTLSTRARGVVLTVVAWRCDGSCIMLGQARTACLAWHTDAHAHAPAANSAVQGARVHSLSSLPGAHHEVNVRARTHALVHHPCALVHHPCDCQPFNVCARAKNGAQENAPPQQKKMTEQSANTS